MNYLQGDLITVSLTMPPSALPLVYALLAGTSAPAVSGNSEVRLAAAAVTQRPEPSPSVVAGVAGTTDAPASSEASGELDAAGWPWSADMHASTKAQTGAGLWRMKPGVARPDPKPGFSSGSEPATTTAQATPPPATEEDDEFAAFRAAATEAEPVKVAERKWTDADLSKLCNQAALKVGAPAGPVKVKEIIAKFVPAGEPIHSRSIPTDQRETFAREVETSLDLTYEG